MAISAHELRIGNLVFDHLGRAQMVAETRSDAYICYLSNGAKLKYKLNTTQPIPLTEEWLLKFGLTDVTEELDTEKSFEIQFDRKAFRVVIDDSGLCTVIYQVDIGMNFQELTDVEFVHEFQNLIFALCGEELKLN